MNAHVSLNLLNELRKRDKMGLDVRKPVFWGLQTTKTQTSLHIRAV